MSGGERALPKPVRILHRLPEARGYPVSSSSASLSSPVSICSDPRSLGSTVGTTCQETCPSGSARFSPSSCFPGPNPLDWCFHAKTVEQCRTAFQTRGRPTHRFVGKHHYCQIV